MVHLSHATMISMLAKEVRDYYFEHIDELDEAHRFHFASRLGAWSRDDTAIAELEALKSTICPNDNPHKLRTILQDCLNKQLDSGINAMGVRGPYFEKFPSLRGIDFALFKVRHWQTIYGFDGRDILEELLPKQEAAELQQTLLADQEAIAFLSTYAINFLYLRNRIIDQDDSFDPAVFFDIERFYDLSDKTHLQLYVYLYTHCIIGESNFYARPITANNRTYQEMLRRLEATIEANYDDINLDNKLEFLVCARILGQTSRLAERIYAEAEKSVSPEGTFLIDIHNNNAQANKLSFNDSEHRNVLYIMSCTDYNPTS